MAVLSQTSSRNKNEEFTTIDRLYKKKNQQNTIILSSKPYTFWLLCGVYVAPNRNYDCALVSVFSIQKS